MSGSETPGFNFAICGSFHFLTMPRYIAARTGPVILSGARALVLTLTITEVRQAPTESGGIPCMQ